MKGKRHTPEQIVRKLREADRLQAEGADVDAVCRHLEVSVQTYQRWRAQYRTHTAASAVVADSYQLSFANLSPLGGGTGRSPSGARSVSRVGAPCARPSDADGFAGSVDLLVRSADPRGAAPQPDTRADVYRSALSQVVSMKAVLATTANAKTRSPSSSGFADTSRCRALRCSRGGTGARCG